uniref:TIR domain-containing protein n=1 Tax=Davidia involucrata TaxID=16924 RepID=A0A5B6YU28_DAVIN
MHTPEAHLSQLLINTPWKLVAGTDHRLKPNSLLLRVIDNLHILLSEAPKHYNTGPMVPCIWLLERSRLESNSSEIEKFLFFVSINHGSFMVVAVEAATVEDCRGCNMFLSFRGENTRHNFTDRLYSDLVRNDIRTFRDEEELEQGNEIAPSVDQRRRSRPTTVPRKLQTTPINDGIGSRRFNCHRFPLPPAVILTKNRESNGDGDQSAVI